jgi:hypothetical protein
MEDETLATQVPPSVDEAQAIEAPIAEEAANGTEQPIEDCAAGAAEESQESPALDTEVAPELEAAAQPPEEEALEQGPESEQENAPAAETPADEEQPSAELEDALPAPAEAQDDSAEVEDAPLADPSPGLEVAPETETAVEEDTVPEPEAVEEPAADESAPEPEDLEGDAQAEQTGSPEVGVEQQDNVAEESVPEPTQEKEATVEKRDVSDPAVEEPGSHHETPADEADAPESTEDTDSDAEAELRSHREFTPVDRKASLRTEALIQAAARAVIARIEKRNSGHGTVPEQDNELDNSLLSTGSQDTYVVADPAAEGASVYGDHHSPSRPSSQSQVRHIPSRSTSSDEGGRSGSHNDDDVFSERSARSSVYSLDPRDMYDVKTPHAEENLSRRESFASSRQSPRVLSGLSAISGLSQYDKDQFVPTSRENRMPFRTPSEIRAMQMSSPTPSVFNGSSPRSSKRHTAGSTGFPTMSRVSSPIASAQYSPKGRSTPPRFKARKEAPLVLLHVTLLPLRWVWGDVLNGLDALHGKSIDEAGPTFEPSDQLKTLRDSWRQLQDRVGDTVLERGILLPHPQDDYEVLEERLLDALELPLRRRARVLECGHYLGPANFMGDEEEESDDDYASQAESAKEEKKHWCNTCRNEIRYEDLGPGKVFRIKVYASNGLMRAGAWEACWKEMERVDVEVEPIVDSALQNELERLVALQLELEEQRQRREMELERDPEPEPEQKREPTSERESRADTPSRQHTERHSECELSRADTPAERNSSAASNSLVRAATPAQSRPVSRLTEPIDTSEERRRRDEERLREIYGDMSPPPAQSPQPASVATTQLVPAQPLPAPTEHQHPQQQQQLYAHSHALMPVPAPSPPPPMLTDAHHHHHHHPPQHMNEDPYSRTHNHEKRGGPPPRVFDENSGFVELFMEAFKVLLRDPKNVAIIVLCVFLVVMMKARNGGYLQEQAQAQAVVQMASSPPPPPPAGGQVPAQGYAYQGQLEGARQEVVVVGVVREKVAPAADVVEPAFTSELSSSSVSMEMALPAVHVENAAAPSAAEAVVMEQDVVAEQQVLMENLEPEAKAPAEDGSVDEEIPAMDANTLAFSPVADILAGGFQLPTSMPMEEAPESVETETAEEAEAEQLTESPQSLGSEQPDAAEPTPEVEDAAAETGEPNTSESAPDMEDSAYSESEASAPSSVLKPTEKVDAAEQADANAAADDIPSAGEECSAAPEPTTASEEEEEEQPIDRQCEVDADSDSGPLEAEEEQPASSSTPSSSSSVFIPGPFVTQHKTVRVFETVTETVRVSVVTQTETVSTVVTAVPQTVEETVYETETVRITVSVPVEEQEQGRKAKPTGSGSGSGKKGKGGGSCGGWF